jgi:glyoxylase-like metal-dependent hydrolase (beta-lactamase superfamily II)
VRVDRVAEDIFVFVSDLYIQVVSTVLLTKEGAIVVDTMPFPSETREVIAFVEDKLGPNSVRYVINTHHHADHVYGTYLFEGAEVIAHDRCRETLARWGQARLDHARKETPALAEVRLCLPDITFRREMHLHLGHRDIRLFHTPGHTTGSISAYVMGEKVLIAGDVVMPVPHIVGGDVEQLKKSLLTLKAINPGFVIQGHGNVLLRGEAPEMIDSSVAYLSTIVEQVSDLVERGLAPSKLREIDIESCGKSRVPLNGLVSNLHLANLVALYKQMTRE